MTAPVTSESWTTRRLLAWMTPTFEARGIDSPRRMAEELLSHVLGCERMRLYMDADRPASALERDTLRSLVTRALKHEPIQYLVGEETFYGLRFKVDPRVLIPRPSTATLVEAVLRHMSASPGLGGPAPLLADVCTGSGAIGLTLARHLPSARVVATDLSPDALAVARENAARLGVSDRVDFEEGDLLGAFDAHAVARQHGTLTALCANPPYIPDHEWDAVEANVKNHEPHLALRGGADGLRFVRPLIERGPERLIGGGLLAIEIAACTSDAVRALARAHPMLERAEVLRDGDGLDRVLTAVRL
jgi:release factor glutamine methyltransferase